MLISSVYPEPSLFLTLPVDLRSGRSGKGSAFKHGDTDLAEDSADKWHCWHYFVLDLLHTYPASSLLFHRACASSSRLTWNIWCQFHLSIYFSLEVFVQKNAKALTKERSVPSSKYCIKLYLVGGLHIKPKFKAFLPSLMRVCWARWTQHSRPSSKQWF